MTPNCSRSVLITPRWLLAYMIYSFWIFDRHTECIFRRIWNADAQNNAPNTAAKAEDIAKLIFGISLSLRNMARKLSNDDAFLAFSTSKYKLHYFETASNLKLVFLTDPGIETLSAALKRIYQTIYLDYVVKNPLSPVEHSGGEGVDNELFTMSLDAYVNGLPGFSGY